MALRVIVLVALATLPFAAIGHADSPPVLPSNKAEVVIPLLNQISQKDSPQEAMDKLHKILGASAIGGEAGGPRNRFWVSLHYELDDKTQIDEDMTSNQGTRTLLGFSITVQRPNGKPEVLYLFRQPQGNSN